MTVSPLLQPGNVRPAEISKELTTYKHPGTFPEEKGCFLAHEGVGKKRLRLAHRSQERSALAQLSSRSPKAA